jgi:hypothetical protein
MPYGKKDGPHMESAKQERKNLIKDMPVDKRASAMQMGHSPLEGHCKGSPAKMGHESPMNMGGSWMSKHAVSSRFSSSPLNQERPDPNSLKNEKGQSQKQVMDSRVSDMKEAESKTKNFQNRFKDLAFNTQDQVDRYNKKDSTNVANYNKSREAAMKSYDSITGVNDAYNKKVTAYNKKLDNMLDTPLNQGLILKNDKRPKEVIQAEMREQIRRGEEDGRLAPRGGAAGVERIARDPKISKKPTKKKKTKTGPTTPVDDKKAGSGPTPRRRARPEGDAGGWASLAAIPSTKLTKAQKKKLSSTKYKK